MTKTLWTEGTPDHAWDSAQTTLGAHFLQQSAWARFQVSLGKRVLYSQGDGWSWVALVEPSRIGIRLYCPFGPTASSKKALDQALQALASCATSLGAMFVRVEPPGPFQDSDFRALKLAKSPKDIQPRFTLVADLAQEDEALYRNMSSTNRRLYRQAEQRGFSFSESTDPADISIFLDMIHQVAARSHIQVHQDAYFTAMAEALFPIGASRLAMVLHEGRPAATCLTFETAATTYYAHAGTANEFRQNQPGVPLMGHMILEAKDLGKKYFDFYGIAPPYQPNHKLRGVTQFKKSFGGETVDQHGTWELPINKLRYFGYKTARRWVG